MRAVTLPSVKNQLLDSWQSFCGSQNFPKKSNNSFYQLEVRLPSLTSEINGDWESTYNMRYLACEGDTNKKLKIFLWTLQAFIYY